MPFLVPGISFKSSTLYFNKWYRSNDCFLLGLRS